ncbi:ABC transporter permease, partial [Asticcacaulis biprosthecium]
VRYELTYDRWMPDAAKVYELTTTYVVDGKAMVPWRSGAGAALDALRGQEPDLVGTRMVSSYAGYSSGGDSFSEEEFLVDPDFFKVFQLTLLAGDKRQALEPGHVAISETIARKYFGTTQVIGRRLILRDARWGTQALVSGIPPAEELIISAVVQDVPSNSRRRFNILRRLTAERMAFYAHWQDWGAAQHFTYLRLDTPRHVQSVNGRLDHLVDTTGAAAYGDITAPHSPRHSLLKIRFSRFGDWRLGDDDGLRTMVLVLTAAAPLALIVALLNYVNLSTVLAGLRAREIVLRKMMGSTRKVLLTHFLVETALWSVMALLLGFSFVEGVLPVLNRSGGLSLRIGDLKDFPLIVGLSMACLVGALLAGLYPAWTSTRSPLAANLSGTGGAFGGRAGHKLRQILVALQFSCVTIFFILLVGFSSQVLHAQRSDLGFSREGLLTSISMAESGITQAQATRIWSEWKTLPGVESIGAGPVPGNSEGGGFTTPTVLDPDTNVNVRIEQIAPEFFSTLGVPILAGRNVTAQDSVTYDMPFDRQVVTTSVCVVANAQLTRHLGFSSPEAALGHEMVSIGKRLKIVGVVGDQRFEGPANAIMPIVYIPTTDILLHRFTVLRYQGVSETTVRSAMREVWQRIAPEMPLEIKQANDHLDAYYVSDRRMINLFLVGTLLVAAVGMVGLYGLAAFSTSARTAEIGIRKAMGATRWSVVRLLLFQFLKPVLLANLIAWPVAYIVLDRWLKQFDDRVPLSLWFFLAGSGISLTVAVLTVAGLAFTAAGTTPGKALRHE